MRRKIDLEKIFSQISSEFKKDDELIKQEFLAEVKMLAEEWLRKKQATRKKK